MIPLRQEKKSCKKSHQKVNPKMKNSISLRQQGLSQFQSLIDCNFSVLRKKYIEKQVRSEYNSQMRKLIQNKNKITTQFRLQCSQKEYMVKFYQSSTAILKLRLNSESKNNEKDTLGIHIVGEQKIDKILSSFLRSKYQFLAKLNRIQHHDHHEKNLKNHSRILSTECDESEACLKTLVTKLQHMIQSQFHFSDENLHSISDISIREESNDVTPFDASQLKISEINHHKNEITIDNHHIIEVKAEDKKKIRRNYCVEGKFGGTQPLISLKPTIMNEYGMVRYFQDENKLKARRTKKTKNSDNSNSSRKGERSGSRGSKKGSLNHKKQNTKTTGGKKKQQPYNPKKGKKKEIMRFRSPQ